MDIRNPQNSPDALRKARLSLQTAKEASAFRTETPRTLEIQAKSRKVESDPPLVNASSKRLPTKTSTIKLEQFGVRERPAMTRLITLTGKDYEARKALESLVQNNRMSSELIAQLDVLAVQDLEKSIPRAELVSDLLQEIENPTAISQRTMGTCAATVAQIMLARTDPTEYVRLVAGLASPDGTVQLKNGSTIAREPDWNASNDGKRSKSSRLLQPAFMEYGNGTMEYDNTKDEHYPLGMSGLSVREAQTVYSGITGKTFGRTLLTEKADQETVDAAFQKLAEAVKTQPVPVGVLWNDETGGGHKILVEKIEGDRVFYTNPWGSSESMLAEEFKRRLRDLNLPE